MRSEKQTLREEKKNVEYVVFDLIKMRELDKQKLKRTREDNESLKADREVLREEKDALKQEKKKLEHAVYDLSKTHELDKQKLNKIRATCDE